MPDTSMYRRQAGEEVIRIVCKARNKAYGDAEDNFGNIAEIMNTLLGPKLCEELTSVDVARVSAAIKLGRLVDDPEHEDSWIDLAGYALCALGIIRARKAREFAEAEIEEPFVAKDVNSNLGLGDFDPFTGFGKGAI